MESTDHKHRWEPIQNWSAKYRCAICGCIAYRNINGAVMGAPLDSIIPYKCNFNRNLRAPCGKDAVQRRGAKNRCSEHKE